MSFCVVSGINLPPRFDAPWRTTSSAVVTRFIKSTGLSIGDGDGAGVKARGYFTAGYQGFTDFVLTGKAENNF
jgi:hypothetical protein